MAFKMKNILIELLDMNYDFLLSWNCLWECIMIMFHVILWEDTKTTWNKCTLLPQHSFLTMIWECCWQNSCVVMQIKFLADSAHMLKTHQTFLHSFLAKISFKSEKQVRCEMWDFYRTCVFFQICS